MNLASSSLSAASASKPNPHGNTLLIRNIPDEVSDDALKELLIRHGALNNSDSIRIMSRVTGKLKSCAFATFSDETKAKTALEKLTASNRSLRIEYAKPASQPKKDIFPSVGSTPIAPQLGLSFPSNPSLEYAYPSPSPLILSNISSALQNVPRFYTQVLHLMNKMNLPPPFSPSPFSSSSSSSAIIPPPPPPIPIPIPPPPPLSISSTPYKMEEDSAQKKRKRRNGSKKNGHHNENLSDASYYSSASVSDESEQENDEDVPSNVKLAAPVRRMDLLKQPQPVVAAKRSKLLVSIQSATAVAAAAAAAAAPSSSITPDPEIRVATAPQIHEEDEDDELARVVRETAAAEEAAKQKERMLEMDGSSSSSDDDDVYDERGVLILDPEMTRKRKAEREKRKRQKKEQLLKQQQQQQQVDDQEKKRKEAEETELLQSKEEQQQQPKHKFLSESEISALKISAQEMSENPLFKDTWNPGAESNVLFLKNLNHKSVTESDLHAVFGHLFPSPSSSVEQQLEIRLMKEGRMKGQAFVTFPSTELASRALHLVHGVVLHEKPIFAAFGKGKKM